MTSTYHYLELRFSRSLRLIVAYLSMTALLFFVSIVVYLPALALEQVTSIDVDITCITIFIICVSYTSMGGMKAVVWTDVFQLFFMFLSIGYVLVVATMKAGGPAAVFHTNHQVVCHI